MVTSPDRPYAYLRTENDFRQRKKSEYGTIGISVTGAFLSVTGMMWVANEISQGNITMGTTAEILGTGMIAALGILNIALTYLPLSTLRGISQERWLRGLINSGQIIEASLQTPPSVQIGRGVTRPTFLQKALSAPKSFRRN